MENQRIPLLTWSYHFHGKTINMSPQPNEEELRNSLFYTALELRKRDDQLIHLTELLNRTMEERDEAQEKFQKLLLILGHHHQPNLSGVSSISDEPTRNSDGDESIVSSPVPADLPPQRPPKLDSDSGRAERPLPEKGKLLQAVMTAGPLLQTLLLAGQLPEWRNPPPPVESSEIPPVSTPAPPPRPPILLLRDSLAADCGRISRKRGISDGSDSPAETKFQRVALN